MRPGLWTSYLYGLSPEEMVKTFARKGWRELEMSDEHASDLLRRGDPAKTGQAFRRFASAEGVGFPQGHLWLSCDICVPEQLEGLKPWLDLFVALGVEAAVLHPGGHGLIRDGAPAARVVETRRRSLETVCARLRGEKMAVCLENMHDFCNTAQGLREVIAPVGSDNLAICLDTGHLNISTGCRGQRDFILSAGPLLKALHIADNEGEKDQHMMPFGRGTVAWAEVMAALKEVGYKGLFNYEIPGESRCPMEARLAKMDYIKAILPILMEMR